MRKIKFRGWDEHNKKLFIVTEIKWDNFGNLLSASDALYSNGYYSPGFNYSNILSQYTGFKDINNKEIYEGDIIEYERFLNNKSRISKVEWACLEDMETIYHEKYCEYIVGKDTLVDVCTNCKIIGNIFENPELLDGIK